MQAPAAQPLLTSGSLCMDGRQILLYCNLLSTKNALADSAAIVPDFNQSQRTRQHVSLSKVEF
jgi:hypothetical protein